MTDLFESKVAAYLPRLMADLGLTKEQAAGVFGNIGHECAGFKSLQEIAPTVKGSRGGYGWMQWTGPRRRSYEAWCSKNGLKSSADDANYRYLVHETETDEKASLAALRRTTTVETATRSFCDRNLRPGTPHYASRLAYAKRALVAVAPAPAIISQPLVTPSAPPAHGLFGKLGALFGRKDVPVIKATKGDPLVYSVQEQLQAKGYYLTGQLDGLDGRKTRDAVASIRKDNNLGDGGMDEDFIKRLPSFPQKPVAVERAEAGVAKAAAARPEVFSAPTNLTVGGLTIGGLSGILGGAGDTITKFKDTADKAGNAFDTVQGIISPVASVVAWCLAHPFVVFGCIGAWFFVKGLMRVLDLWLRFRQDRI